MSEKTEQIRYEIVRKIARGGMGEVFLARQIGFGGFAKDVVLKRIHEDLAGDPDFVEQFLEEARIAAMLDHPNIVQILGLGQHDQDHFMVMEFVHGLSLSRLMKKLGRPLPLPVAVQVAIDVAAGLQFAHDSVDPSSGESLNLVHRDISPPNILVSTSGGVKITDFGIAKVKWSTSNTRAGVVKGKYSYLSPEQVRGKKATRQSDLYALGLNLYEMTTGQRAYPIEGDHAEVLKAVARGKIRPPDEHVSDYPAKLEEILMRTLAVKPEQRYPSCAELQEDLHGLMQAWEISMPPSRLGTFVQQVMKGETISELPAVESPTAPGVGEPAELPADPEDDLFQGGDAEGKHDTQVVEITTTHLTAPVLPLPDDAPEPEPEPMVTHAPPALEPTASSPALAGVIESPTPGPETADAPMLAGVIESPTPGPETADAPMLAGVIESPTPAPEALAPATPALADPFEGAELEPEDAPTEEDLTEHVQPGAMLPALGEEPPRRRRAALIAVALLLLGGGGVLWLVLAGNDGTPAVAPSPGTGSVVQTEAAGAGGPPSAMPLAEGAVVEPLTATPGDAGPVDLPLVDLPSMPPPDRSVSAPPAARKVQRPRGPTVLLSVSSDPPTTVYSGGRRLGRTPLDVRVPKAQTTLRLINREVGLLTKRVITPHTSRVSAHFVFRKGKIGFRTSQAYTAYIGGKRIGVTPLPLTTVYEGTHKVALVARRGGRRHSWNVTVWPGRTAWVEVE